MLIIGHLKKTDHCNKILETGEWPTTWTHSLVIILPKKGNLQLCQNYRTINLISRPSKVILNIILNRLQPQAEDIIAEEQTGFRAGRSTTEKTFSLRILGEKYLQLQQNLYHVFIDLKKTFDRVWHEALWAHCMAGVAPPYKNVRVGYSIHTFIKRLKSTFYSYNYFSYINFK